MKPVEFTGQAKAEDFANYSHLLARSPQAARAYQIAIGQITISIKSMPEAGTPFGKNLRYKMLSGFPYKVFYRIRAERIQILSIFHTSQNPRRTPQG